MKPTEAGIQYLKSRAPDLEQTSLGETLLAAVIEKKEVREELLTKLFWPIPASRIEDTLEMLEKAGYVWQS